LNAQVRQLQETLTSVKRDADALSRSVASFAHTVDASGEATSDAVVQFVDSLSDSLRLAHRVGADTQTRIRAAHDELLASVGDKEASLAKLESL
jgi:hypothetical protein